LEFNLCGISEELLGKLSFESQLGKSFKNTLRKFKKEDLINEIIDMKEFYESTDLLKGVYFAYRVKSIQSCLLKFDKYYPRVEVNKCFNDILGIRIILNNYNEVLNQDLNIFKVADMINGKANDDGYRGLHLYYQKSNKHYPIEIQINTKHDRIMNDWLHMYVYKYEKNNVIGELLRKRYDSAEFQKESDFKEVLKNVLSSSQEI
jgi:ppGpp synthetase/RelA/SpoT-type nucleotidyltranferase